jgi:hypothetical protein
MGDKFTYRDIIVYTLNGLIGSLLLCLIFRDEILNYLLINDIRNSEFIIVLIIPISYLIGHVIMTIDDILFNQIIRKKIRKNLFKSNLRILRFLHNIIFGYRIIGKRDIIWKNENTDFEQICVIIRNKGRYEFADKYFILSDFFKGLVINELLIIAITIIKSDWIYLICSSILLILFYFRARTYSDKYVNEIKYQSRIIEQN